MKTFLALTLLCLSSLSLAAPVCFDQTDGQHFLPKEICFEKVEADTWKEVLTIKDTANIFPGTLQTNYFHRYNENGFSFRASHEYMNIWGGCEEGITVVLNLKGRVDNDGILQWVEVSADWVHAFDSCHSRETKGTTIYKSRH